MITSGRGEQKGRCEGDKQRTKGIPMCVIIPPYSEKRVSGGDNFSHMNDALFAIVMAYDVVGCIEMFDCICLAYKSCSRNSYSVHAIFINRTGVLTT